MRINLTKQWKTTKEIRILYDLMAWVMLLAVISTCIVSNLIWKVEATENTMYGIWCPICVKRTDTFVGIQKAKDRKEIHCKGCDSILLEIESRSETSHYSSEEGESTSWFENRIVKVSTGVTFPWVEAYLEGDDESEDSYRVRTQGDIYGNMVPNSYGWTTEQVYDQAKALVVDFYRNIPIGEFHWTQWYDTGKIEYENGTSYTGLSAYLNAFGIAAQRVDRYTVSYHANGGEGSMEAQISDGGTTITLTANAFAKPGYSFAGWATSASGNVEYTDGASITPTSDITLYAIWTVKEYEVTCIDMDSTHNVELGRTTMQKPYGTKVKGSDFGSVQDTGAYYEGYSFTVGTSTMVSEDSNVVYRYFQPQSYKVILVDMVLGEDTILGTEDSLEKLAGDTIRGMDYGTTSPYEGYTFESDTSALVTASGATVYRYFKRNVYMVSYIDMTTGEEGKELGRQTANKGYHTQVSGSDMGSDPKADMYYPGYYYTGDSTTAMVTIHGAEVYRYFAPASYDITYISVLNDVDGKELGREEKVGAGVFGTTVSGDTIGTDTTDGAYFPGYSYFASTQTIVTENGAVVYRIFKSSSYKLRLELNGGRTDKPMESYQYGVTTILPAAYKTGYSFAGWYDNAACAGEPITEINEVSIGEKTFYAAWSHDKYKIMLEYPGTGSSVSVYREGTLVEDNTLYYGDTIQVEFGSDAGKKQNGYDITSSVTEVEDIGTGIVFTMPDNDVSIQAYWLECRELQVSLNSLFFDTYQKEPYWNGETFNVDAKPAITIDTDMLDVVAHIYDTREQRWLEKDIPADQLFFEGSNTITNINTTLFTVCADVFQDGAIQKGTFSLTMISSSLNDMMDHTHSQSYEELKGYMDKLEQDMALYEQLVVDLQTKLLVSDEKKAAYQKMIKDLTEQLAEAQTRYEESVIASGKRIEELEKILEEKRAEYEATREELTKKLSEVEKALENTETLSAEEIAALTAQKEELYKELENKTTSYQQETAKLKKELDTLYKELEAYKEEIDRLAGKLETTKKAYEEEIAGLETELKEIRDKMAKLLEKIAAMEEVIKELLGKENLDISNGSLEEFQNILKEMKDKLQHLNNQNQNLQDQVDNLYYENDRLKDTIDQKKDTIIDLKQVIQELKEQQKNQENSSSEIFNQKYQEVKKENKKFQEQIQEKNQMIQKQEEVIQRLEIEKVALETELKTQKESLAEKTAIKDKLEAEKQHLAQMLLQKENHTGEAIVLKQELAEYKNQLLFYQEQAAKQGEELLQKDQEILKLKQDIMKLENKKETEVRLVGKETEVSLSEADTQLLPLRLITISETREKELPKEHKEETTNGRLEENKTFKDMDWIVAMGAGSVFLIGIGMVLIGKRRWKKKKAISSNMQRKGGKSHDRKRRNEHSQ